MLALLAAKALDANNNADPINRLFDTVANFMTAPFFFPECTSGSGWGGPAHDHREKTLVFPRESPTMQPLGFGKQAARPVLLRVGVFLTWAAKPSVGRSPEPRKICGTISSSRLGCLATRLIPDYALLALKVPESLSALFTMLGRELHAWVSKKMISVGYNFGTVVDCLRSRRVEGIKVVL